VSDSKSMRQEVKRLKEQIALQTKEITQLIARQRRRDRVHRHVLQQQHHSIVVINTTTTIVIPITRHVRRRLRELQVRSVAHPTAPPNSEHRPDFKP
jgi:hypothetical protein